MSASERIVGLMGITLIVAALVIASVVAFGRFSRLTDEQREIILGGSMFLAALGTVFVIVD